MTRVLIVDDQPAFRANLSQLLTQVGLVVVGEAGDIPEADAQVQALRPDLAVVDIMLPGMNGLDGTRRLKAQAPAMRVIVVSAYGDETEAWQHAAIEAGAEQFVSKDDLEAGLVRRWTMDPSVPVLSA
jgi:two-component system chemotaxis response regulator CheB